MFKLSDASTIIDTALAEGRTRGLAPLAVAVLDAGGHLVAYKREDGAGIVRFDIAFGKAWGSLGMGFGSRELTERAGKNPTFVTVLSAVSGGRMVPSPGGVLIANGQGHIIGAVGISGDLGDNDELCAIAGIEKAGSGLSQNLQIDFWKNSPVHLKGSLLQTASCIDGALSCERNFTD